MEEPSQQSQAPSQDSARTTSSRRISAGRRVEKSRKNKGGSLAVAVVFAIVGYLLASQLQSVRNNTQAAAADTGFPPKVEA